MRSIRRHAVTTTLAGMIAALALSASPAAALATPLRVAPANPSASPTTPAVASAGSSCPLVFQAFTGADLRRVDVRPTGSPPVATLTDCGHAYHRSGPAPHQFIGADPSRVIRAVGFVVNTWDGTKTRTTDDPAPDTWQTLALRGDSLVTMSWEKDLMPAGHAVLDSRGSHEYTGMTVQGHGWAAFTQLLEHPFAREFYAFAPGDHHPPNGANDDVDRSPAHP